MKPKIKRSHYRKNINQVYYLLKLKPSCNKIQKCAQIILLHDEFYTLLSLLVLQSGILPDMEFLNTATIDILEFLRIQIDQQKYLPFFFFLLFQLKN